MAMVWISLFCLLPTVLCGVSLKLNGTAADDSRTVAHLVTVGNTTEGVRISIFLDGSDSLDDSQQLASQELNSDLVKGFYLSPSCGIDFQRCRDLFVKRISTNITDQYIVFVPLASGILLVELIHNGYTLAYKGYTAIETAYEYGCSPTTILPVHNSIYAVCVNTKTPFLSIFEIDLPKSTSSLDETLLSHPLNHFYNFDPHTQLSNFEFVSLDDGDAASQLIFFALGNKLHVFVPLDGTDYQYGPPLETCTSVQRLEYAGDFVLLAYCENNLVEYFDLYTESVLNHTDFKMDGLPYLCPNRDVHFSVYSFYIQFGVWSGNSRQDFAIPGGLSFESGLCFGSEAEVNDTYFAFVDNLSGVFVFDPIRSRVIELSAKACQNSCEPIMVFQNRYVVFQEQSRGSENVIVVDYTKDFSRVIEAWSTKADLLAVITVTCKKEEETDGDSISDSVNIVSKGGSGLETGQIIAIVIGCVVGPAVVIVLVGFGVYFYIRLAQPPPQPPQPGPPLVMQETGGTDHSDLESGRIGRPGEGSRGAEAPEQLDTRHDDSQPRPLVGNKKPVPDSKKSPATSLSQSVENDSSDPAEPLSNCDRDSVVFPTPFPVEDTAASLNGTGHTADSLNGTGHTAASLNGTGPGNFQNVGMSFQPKLATLEEMSAHVASSPQPSDQCPSPAAQCSNGGTTQPKSSMEARESVNSPILHESDEHTYLFSGDDVPSAVAVSNDSDNSFEGDDRCPLLAGVGELPISSRRASDHVIAQHRSQNDLKDDPEVMETANNRQRAANSILRKK